jgi:ABC-2 type transport system permease protein
MTFILLPLCCVYYPVAILPPWLQWIALALPPTHVFEGLRTLLIEHRLALGEIVAAFLLNLIYLAAAGAAFGILLRAARKGGALMQTGE